MWLATLFAPTSFCEKINGVLNTPLYCQTFPVIIHSVFCLFQPHCFNSLYSGTSLIRSSKMRTPPSTGHHQESSCFCFVCFCQINLGGASGLVACARMAIITLYSVLHYIVLVSVASTTRRKRSLLTLEKKLEIIGELKKGKSLRCVSGLYDVPKSTVVSHSQTLWYLER